VTVQSVSCCFFISKSSLVGDGKLPVVLGERPARAAAAEEAKGQAVGPPDGKAWFSRVFSLLRRWPKAAPGSPWRDPVIWAIAATSFGAYFVISLYKLLQLAPSSYDLGIYTEFVKQLSQLHAPIVDMLAPGFNLEGNHFQIAVGVIAPFFRLFPTPATLLFFQALFVGVSVFPVAAAAFSLTMRGTGRLIAFAYAFSWGLQQMIDFDFHEIALAVPLLAFSLSALVRRRPATAIAWAMPLVFVEESQGFTVAAIGLFLWLASFFPAMVSAPPGGSRPGAEDGLGDSRVALWGGLFLMVWGLLWSTLAITVIIPHFNPLHQYYFWKDGGAIGGGNGFSVTGVLVQAGGGWPTKAPTLVLLLLPTAFAALGSPVALIALPSLALRFISPNTAYWGTNFHYDATIMPILFIAAADGIRRWRRAAALTWPLATGIPEASLRSGPGVASTALAGPELADPGVGGPVSAGPVLAGTGKLASENAREANTGHGPAAAVVAMAVAVRDMARAARFGIARYGGPMMLAVALALAFQFPLSNLWTSSTYKLDAHVAAADAAMAVVPDGATVQTTLGLLAPLAARTDTFWIGTGGNPVTQYIVFDSSDSSYSPPVTDVPQFIASQYPQDGYVQVFDRDGVYVYKRG
jgi:uncharacterized membrane protein